MESNEIEILQTQLEETLLIVQGLDLLKTKVLYSLNGVRDSYLLPDDKTTFINYYKSLHAKVGALKKRLESEISLQNTKTTG